MAAPIQDFPQELITLIIIAYGKQFLQAVTHARLPPKVVVCHDFRPLVDACKGDKKWRASCTEALKILIVSWQEFLMMGPAMTATVPAATTLEELAAVYYSFPTMVNQIDCNVPTSIQELSRYSGYDQARALIARAIRADKLHVVELLHRLGFPVAVLTYEMYTIRHWQWSHTGTAECDYYSSSLTIQSFLTIQSSSLTIQSSDSEKDCIVKDCIVEEEDCIEEDATSSEKSEIVVSAIIAETAGAGERASLLEALLEGAVFGLSPEEQWPARYPNGYNLNSNLDMVKALIPKYFPADYQFSPLAGILREDSLLEAVSEHLQSAAKKDTHRGFAMQRNCAAVQNIFEFLHSLVN